MRAGVAVVDITPSVGTELSGGAFGPARGVLHPLQAKLLCLEQEGERLLLASCDLLGFGEELAGRIRRAISRRTGIAHDAIMLACTHTHGGPATVYLRGWGQPDAAYCDRLTKQLTEASAVAVDSLAPAAVGVGAGECPEISVNRSFGEEGGTNDQLTALRVDGEGGEPLALLVNYASHPVNLHSVGQVTPDFPYYVQRDVQQGLAADVPVLYLTGACGDLNPANFRQGEPSEQAAAETGGQIAAAALRLLEGVQTSSDAELAFSAIDVKLPLQPLPSREELEALIDERGAKMAEQQPDPTNWAYCGHKAAVEWAREALEVIEQGAQQSSKTVTLQAFRIGQAGLVGMPGELFSEFGRDIAASGALEHTFAVTLANGCVGYFPSREAYEIGRYEAVHCPRFVGLQLFAPEVGERIREGALTVLRQLSYMQRNRRSRQTWGRSCSVIVG
ncbi:MAG: hypothetical protein ACOC93_05845, partial [Planctomycetota bacterium]